MGNLRYVLLILFSFAYAIAGAQETQPSNLFNTPGMVFYSPEQYYKGDLNFLISEEMPEVEVLNANKYLPTRKIMNFLSGEGISMGFGVNSNRGSFFDLYGTLSVDVDLNFPEPEFGATKESGGGKVYFTDHDATHLWAVRGVGPRFKDLENRKTTVDRWVKVLMDAEAVATSYNSAYQVVEYWNWRMKRSGASPEEVKRFEELNRGAMSFGNWTYASYLDVVLTNVRGQMFKQYSLLKENISVELYQQGVDANIPQLFTPPRKWVGVKGEEFFVKHVFAPAFSAISFFRPKSGYIDLVKATVKLLEYYYQPFYIRWAEEFKIGDDITTAEKKLAAKIELFRQGNVFGDVSEPKPGQFEVQQVRQLVTQLGRKLIELEELGKKDASLLNEADENEIRKLIEEASSFNRRLIAEKEAGTSYETSEISLRQNAYKDLIRWAEVRFPVSKYIPYKHRLGFAKYENFWSDPYAIIMDRPVVLSKFLSEKAVWKTALKQRLDQQKAFEKGQIYEEIDTSVRPRVIAELEKQAAARYNENFRKGEIAAEGGQYEENYYLNRLEIFRRNLIQQVRNFTEQIKEYEHLTWPEKQEILDIALHFEKTLDQKILEFKAKYHQRFVEMDKDESIKVWLWDKESDIKWAVEKSQVAMIEILDKLDQGKKLSHLKMQLKLISTSANMIAEDKIIYPSLFDTIRKVTPMKRTLAWTICSAVTRMCFNQDLTKIIKGVPDKSYARDSEFKPVLELVKASGERTAELPNLPKDAVIILGMNHDHAALDAKFLLQIAEKLGVEKNMILTTQEAWPHFAYYKNKDPYLALKQEVGFKDRILRFLKSFPGKRTGFSIFAEGELPFWGVQFPLFANFGAFKLARRAAFEITDRPVYYIEIHANFLRYVTARNDIPIKIDIIEPELVPKTPISDRDEWIETHRTNFEIRANDPDRRGEMYDLINREKIAGGRINTTEVPRKYIPASEAMPNLITPNKCHAVFQ